MAANSNNDNNNNNNDPSMESSRHIPHTTPITAEEEEVMSSTHHESLLAADEKIDELAASLIEEEEAEAKKESAPQPPHHQQQKQQQPPKIPLKLQQKVAEIAAKAYRNASDQSNVLSRAKLADIALVKFEEISIGKFLGKGSFSNVHEICKVQCIGLDDIDENDLNNNNNDDSNDDDDDDDDEDQNSWNGEEEDPPIHTIHITTLPTHTPSSESERFTKDLHKSATNEDDARRILTMHHRRNVSGTCRYAIKFLKEKVRSNPTQYAVGTADLVLEGMFLASLSHPNIIKVRGLPEGGVKSLITSGSNSGGLGGSGRGSSSSKGYFLILDRLFDTLSDRIYNTWKVEHRLKCQKRFVVLKNKQDAEERDGHLAERLKVAFDICAALKYLHSKHIIYRDLKPENLGFDVRGDIKLFDLGLVKELHPKDADPYGDYRMSMAGTPRYMAPECGTYQPYNLSADVYSFSMLLWEILTLTKPLDNYTYRDLKKEIFLEGDRPPLRKIFNKKMRNLVAEGWDQRANARPSIDKVYDELKKEYVKLSPGHLRENDISHNRRRSTFVVQRLTSMPMMHLMRLNSSERT